MKIKSPFKDYYDFVAFQYGGGDPKIVYPRVRLAERHPEYGYTQNVQVVGLRDLPSLPRSYYRNEHEFDFKWLAIAGKLYLLVKECDVPGEKLKPWGVFRIGQFPELDERLLENIWGEQEKSYEYWVGSKCDKLIPIHRELKAPVFCFGYTFEPGVEGDVPILSELGIPALISPEQMYQELSYFMGNIINESPDLQPEAKPPMTDKEKVLSHGFDVKKSFRHRT